jgi:hypothetical protein
MTFFLTFVRKFDLLKLVFVTKKNCKKLFDLEIVTEMEREEIELSHILMENCFTILC